jgi:subtilisin family serine protease
MVSLLINKKYNIFNNEKSMNSKTIKLSALALAVTGALCSTAQANDYQKYNLTAQKQIKSSVVNKKEQALKLEVTNWLLKLDTPAAAQAQEFGVDVASVRAKAIVAQVGVEQAISSMDLPIEIITKTSLLVNSLVVKGSQKDVESLLGNPLISEIYPVLDYKLDVADSADYITATPLVENQLATGTGIKVAVLDTGIDYTHAAFGGAGTSEAYAAAIADAASVDWPQGQVKGGYDYINNDADPIDVDTSHGTHVSNSVNGIAPNVDLFVYSVCNNDNCPGLAQILALENAMDPDTNGDISDRVDVINMSLGGDYGDIANDAVGLFINQAVKLGTNVVISAGNDGAYPFIVGGPSTTESALSVGAMTHPTQPVANFISDVAGEKIELGTASFGDKGEFSISSNDTELVYPAENQDGCDEFVDTVDFTGKAVIIDRGGCGFSEKALNAQKSGAKLVIVANNADGAAPGMSGGPEASEVTIPVVSVTQDVGQLLKDALAKNEQPEYSMKLELIVQAGAIADFTSRGPSMGGLLKPEITAPGVNIMTATPGAGDGLAPISGTSFSAPITAGAISLLKEALPERNAFELKATLMNAANLDVTMEPRALNPEAELAPISYIGAGLVDVTKAANLPVAAWAKDTKQAALSFGLVSASEKLELSKTVEVKNFSNEVKVYTLSLEQRYQNDIDRGSFSLDYPATITVPAGQTISFDVTATIDPITLPEWTLDAGNVGSLDATSDLTDLELDGALIFSDGSEPAFHLVYHVLPKANAAVSIMPEMTADGPSHKLTNTGAAAFEPVFAPLTATDEVDEDQRFDIVGASIETFAVSSDVCTEGFVTLTTMILNEGITHTYVGGFMADFDLDQDGIYDVTAQNGKLEWFNDVEPGSAITFTHGYGSTSGSLNNIYQVVGNNHFTLQSCIGAFGLTAADIGNVTADVRFRTEEETWSPIATGLGDTVVASYTFTDASGDTYAALVDGSGNQINKLEVGESATLLSANTDFVILSASGSSPYVATPSADADMAPLLDDAEFSVDENAADGTVIGMLEATYAADFANPIAEYIVTSSTSTAITVNAMGEVVVANSEVLDYDSGLETIELEVVVTDTSGNISEPAVVVVTVNNLADEASEQPVAPARNSSSGSLAWLTLLAAPFAFMRRRKQK